MTVIPKISGLIMPLTQDLLYHIKYVIFVMPQTDM